MCKNNNCAKCNNDCHRKRKCNDCQCKTKCNDCKCKCKTKCNDCQCRTKCNECEHNKCETKKFIAILIGDEQIPSVITAANGRVKATLCGNILNVNGCIKNLESNFISGHIHFGIAGTNGPVIFPLNIPIVPGMRSACFDNNFMLTNNQINQLINRELYINIHTVNNPNGEIRGQLLANACEYFFANLSGDNEVPPITTNGTGRILFELYPRTNTLKATGSVNSLTDVIFAGHIHYEAIGNNGPIVDPLVLDIINAGTGAIVHIKDNVFTLTTEQIKLLRSGQYYTDIHTVAYPTGEIRGQIVKLI